MKKETPIPENGNIYIASVEGLENKGVFTEIQSGIYGGNADSDRLLQRQNTTYNGFEYHKAAKSMLP
jgi:hypothetical protein